MGALSRACVRFSPGVAMNLDPYFDVFMLSPAPQERMPYLAINQAPLQLILQSAAIKWGLVYFFFEPSDLSRAGSNKCYRPFLFLLCSEILEKDGVHYVNHYFVS